MELSLDDIKKGLKEVIEKYNGVMLNIEQIQKLIKHIEND